MDDEKLIEFVKAQPAIYDKTHVSYTNKDQGKKVWQDIAKQMSNTVPACQKRWRYLRDYFVRQLHMSQNGTGAFSKGRKRPLWSLFDKMSFLKPFSSTRRSRPRSQRKLPKLRQSDDDTQKDGDNNNVLSISSEDSEIDNEFNSFDYMSMYQAQYASEIQQAQYQSAAVAATQLMYHQQTQLGEGNNNNNDQFTSFDFNNFNNNNNNNNSNCSNNYNSNNINNKELEKQQLHSTAQLHQHQQQQQQQQHLERNDTDTDTIEYLKPVCKSEPLSTKYDFIPATIAGSSLYNNSCDGDNDDDDDDDDDDIVDNDHSDTEDYDDSIVNINNNNNNNNNNSSSIIINRKRKRSMATNKVKTSTAGNCSKTITTTVPATSSSMVQASILTPPPSLLTSSFSTTTGSRKRRNSEMLKELFQFVKKSKTEFDECDEHEHFFKSLLSSVRKIDEDHIMAFRTEILQIIMKYRYLSSQSNSATSTTGKFIEKSRDDTNSDDVVIIDTGEFNWRQNLSRFNKTFNVIFTHLAWKILFEMNCGYFKFQSNNHLLLIHNFCFSSLLFFQFNKYI